MFNNRNLCLVGVLILGLIIFLPSKTQAAPAYVTSQSTDLTFGNGNTNNDIAFDSTTNGTDRILIVIVSWRDSAGHTINDNAVSYAGASTTAFGVQVANNQATTKAFYLVNPATGSNTLRLYTSGGAGSNPNAMISAYIYSGVDQLTPFDGYATNSGAASDTATLTVTSAVGDTPFFAFSWRGGGATDVTPTNYTERVDNVANSGAVATGGGEGVGAGSINFSGQINNEFANTGWSAIGMNLNSASGIIRRGLMRAFSGFSKIRGGFIRIGK